MNILEKYNLTAATKNIEIELNDILVLDKFQPRKHLDELLVRRLKESDSMPAITIGFLKGEEEKFILVDGNHRYKASYELGKEKIETNIIFFENELEISKASIAANINHGLCLKKDEKRDAIAFLIEAIPEGEFSPADLSRELSGYPSREIRKIFTWVKIKQIIGLEEANNLSISNADILFRLITNGTKEEEFLKFFEKYGYLKQADLQEVVKLFLNNELIEDNSSIEKINDELEDIEELSEKLDALEESDEEDIDEELLETDDEEIEAEYIVKDLLLDLKQRNKIFKKAKKIKYYEGMKNDIEKIEEILSELKKSLKEEA